MCFLFFFLFFLFVFVLFFVFFLPSFAGIQPMHRNSLFMLYREENVALLHPFNKDNSYADLPLCRLYLLVQYKITLIFYSKLIYTITIGWSMLFYTYVWTICR